MAARVLQLGVQQADAEALEEGAAVLRAGGLVAFPTETVYGVGARADCAGSVGRLRELKSRDSSKPFTYHVGSALAAAELELQHGRQREIHEAVHAQRRRRATRPPAR